MTKVFKGIRSKIDDEGSQIFEEIEETYEFWGTVYNSVKIRKKFEEM